MGCSSSSCFISPRTSTIDENALKSVRFLENCLVIWICNETRNRYAKEQEKLRKVIPTLKISHNLDTCLTYLSSMVDEKIFLIISGLSKPAEHFSQFERIYLFNPIDISNNPTTKYRNINEEILTDIDQLCEQLQNDLQLCEMDLISLTIVPGSSKDDAAFLFGQMTKEIIFRWKFDSGAKDVLVDYCRRYYEHHPEQLSIIEDFAQNYRPHCALSWFRRPCFLSQILNRALRTREVDVIYKFGFFIKHVNLQLNRLHNENPLDMNKISFVYRGKTMLDEEFVHRLKNASGSFLSFPDFLLTNIHKRVAMDFIHRRLIHHPHRIGILFQIHMDPTIFSEKNPYALLKDIDQDEICFHMETVFRIQSVEQTIENSQSIWIIELKSVNHDNPKLISLTTSIQSDEMHANPELYLGKLLVDMGEYRRAEQVLLALSEDPSVRRQPRRLARAHHSLGLVYTYQNEHAKALDHYQQLLQISLTYLQPNHPDLSPIYQAIGNTYFSQRKSQLAIENYEKALELSRYSIQPVSAEMLADLSARIDEAKQWRE